MSYKIDNKQIGKYISTLIERNYDSARKFCIEYLKSENGFEPNSDEIQNMANRLSQIKKGSKGIQIHDLPIFSELLHVSCEQILSGGKYESFVEERLNNYSVALSCKKSDWKTYINDENQPILNGDEYGKTVLDYAIDFGNYELIKFLMDENYIWFDSGNEKDYAITFGAGTSISNIKIQEFDNGWYSLKCGTANLKNLILSYDKLRMSIISLAADHNDISMLEKLRAREIPELYLANYLTCYCPDFDAHYDKEMVTHIAKSSGKVLQYFTDSFEIRSRYNAERKHIFVFPYISQLLDLMIVNNSTYLKESLEKMIQHNENVKEKLQSLIKEYTEDKNYENYWKEEIEFEENGNIVHCRNVFSYNGIITNVARATKRSQNAEINKLIEQLNDSYDSIRYIKEN